MLSPQEIDALVAAKAQSPEMEKVMKAVLNRESNYGQNPAAYVANKAGGVIGIGQIQSKQVGGKYNNFENYADAGQTDVHNPIHTANAALNMIADKWNKTKGNPQEFVNEYFGRAAKDKLGGTNIGYVQAINNALSNGVSTPTGTSTFQGVSAGTVGVPASALGEVQAYNKQLVQAAQKIADNNLAAVNNFNWNPNTADSSAQRFGKTVSNNTDALSQLYDTNMKEMQAFTNPTADTYSGRVGDRLGAMWNVSGNTLTERYLKRAEASQSGTGKAMAEQVVNMQNAMKGTVIDPAFLDKAASNLTQQQQVDNQTYNVVTDNLNTQQRYELDKSNSEVANRLNTEKAARDKAEFEATQAARLKVAEQQAALQPAIQEAATAMGLSIPQGMGYNDAVALVPEPQRTEFVTRIANQNRAANSLYDAVIVGQSPYATDAQRRVAAGGESLVRSILSTEGAQQAINAEPTAEGKERVRRVLVQDALDRASFGEASSKEFSTAANNPYSLTNRGEEFFKDIPPLKGVTNPAEFRDIFATILRSSDAGATSAEIASTISAISNKLNDTNKANGLPLPPARLHVKYLSKVYDVTKPVDVAKLRHAMGRETGDKDSITGFIRRRIAEGAGLIDKLTPLPTPITTNTSDQRSRKDFGIIPK